VVKKRMEIHLDDVDATWTKYDLFQAPLYFNGEPSRYKAIIRNDELITILGENYQLIPNEEAVKIADEAAKMAGLVPFSEFSGDWYVKLKEHAIEDRGGRVVHALYAMNEPYYIQGEKMHLGVGIHNSIDGTKAFGCGIFTFRHACANMVLAGTRGYMQSFDNRQTIDYIYKKHTSSMDPLKMNLKNVILRMMDKVPAIINAYNRMAEIQLNEELAEKLRKSRLRKKLLPEYIRDEDAALPDVTNWQVYNDITEAIWHNVKTGLVVKTAEFGDLHKLMPLRVR
jgi:hypothetical protein